MSKNRLKYENCVIKKAIIFSNGSDLDVNLTGAPDVQYAESVFSDTIEVDITFGNTVGSVNGKTVMEGLPLVGTEDFELTIQDPNGNDLKVKLNVNKVTPIRKDTQQEELSLRLTSEEYIRNEELTSRVVKRYDGKISEHIRKILTDNLASEKELFIDETSNNYNFIGNYLSTENPLIKNYIYIIVSIAISTAYFEIFYSWCKVQKKTVFGNFLKEFYQRLLILQKSLK